ncbi:t-SNARE affecting a late Golgi compartment protein 2 [Malassezia cuniculi]|uniref:t-SNARE affecting a late Golgi compartment protein 2 n=1 Tax=Malassezia cuniculi TaxID=948313 RepID=A0AAF0JBH3_9BASI|nr:t-SNARE affecting a late Golgi compartment protein 2 [Malassezia cuniculi]
MLRPTLVRAARAHTPLIRFPDRRAPVGEYALTEPHVPKPHPEAPADIAKDFERFRSVLESGPHFNPDKITESAASGIASIAEDLHELPRHFWSTPALQWSEEELEAVMRAAAPDGAPLVCETMLSAYNAPDTGTQNPALGVVRSRTLLFLSIRDSLGPHAAGEPLLSTKYDDTVVVDMDAPTLPPRWVDATEEVDTILSSIEPRIMQLEKLYGKHLLPSFVDKADQEREIEALTEEITLDFRRASRHVARLASHTTAAMRAHELSPQETAAARNAQTALATKVQQLSSLFRKKQSAYLRRLQGIEQSSEAVNTSSRGLLDIEDVRADVELSQQQLLVQDDALAEIQERDREITQIAKSIAELAQLFQDLSALVIEQGTMLDRIDYNIDNMAHDIRQSGVELDRATAYQAGAGRRQLILLMLLVCALLAAIAIVKPFFR